MSSPFFTSLAASLAVEEEEEEEEDDVDRIRVAHFSFGGGGGGGGERQPDTKDEPGLECEECCSLKSNRNRRKLVETGHREVADFRRRPLIFC